MKLTQVSKNLWRGSRPEFPSDFHELQLFGIDLILNLERGWFEWVHGMMNWETVKAIQWGLTPIHMLLSDFFPPTKPECEAFISLIDRKENIFVHCFSGVDRTGFLCAYYRVERCGYTIGAAIDEMKAMGMHAWYRPFWIPAFIRMFK